MFFLLNAFIAVSLLRSLGSTTEPVPWLSLWGEVADFTFLCSDWRLKPHVSIPALQEFTVCFHLNLETWDSSPWTAFMYCHPYGRHVELGLGGQMGSLVVWLFGVQWTTPQMDLLLSQWYSFCLTWSHTKDRPTLYVNGDAVVLTADRDANTSCFVSPSSCNLSANGSLTLGIGHGLVNGNIQIIPFTVLFGKMSLFRMWAKERSEQELASLSCTEGDLVKWEEDYWDTRLCTPFPDPTLQCKWSFYDVTLMFVILRLDKNETELHTARDVAHQWLREKLPVGMYLHSVSVFDVTRPTTEEVVKASHGDSAVIRPELRGAAVPYNWGLPNMNRFHCLVHVNVEPSWNVAAVQFELHKDLRIPYRALGRLLLLADANSIHTTPTENFTDATVSPEDVSTPSPDSTTNTPTTNATTGSSSSTPPASTAGPGNISELYFEVKMNVSITGAPDPEQILFTWLNSSLPDDSMMVLDFQMNPRLQRQRSKLQSNLPTSDGGSEYRKVFVYGDSRESCVFQVQVLQLLSEPQETEEQIRGLLLTPYNDGSVSLVAEDILISRILKFRCTAETHQSLKGLFTWPDTSGGRNATQTCPRDPTHYATRHCKLHLSTHWMAPDVEDCPPVVETISDLEHVEVTADNALNVVEVIGSLLGNHSNLNYDELATILNKLEDVVNVSMVTPNLGQALVNVISDVLESDSDLMPFTNTILNMTEAVGDKMVGYKGSFTLIAPALAISVVDVVPGQFSSLTFGVSSDQAGTKPEIFINTHPFNGTVAFISLPSALQYSFPQRDPDQNPPRVQFQFYGIPLLFNSGEIGKTLNTFVVSACVTNASSPIKDLAEDVKVILHHLVPNTLSKDVQCVYWNFNKNDGHGGWDDHGCRKYNTSSEYTTCLCDHLTHFGVLLDVSRTELDPANEQILTIITYAGCGVSSLFLGITILTYIAFEKLRRDYPSQILINLSLALLGLNLVFLLNSWLTSWALDGLCVAVASMLHYFLLASFTWMGLEAVNMYFALVKVFNVYVPSYILKFCALGWGLPLVTCILVLIVDREAYGRHLYTDTQSTLEPPGNADNFCWIQDDVTFYVTVVAYAALVFLFNTGVFAVVLVQIRRMRVNSPAGSQSGLMHDLKAVSSLTLLLGLTWTVGFFTWGPARVVLLYLFAGLNTLQGLFIFLFHCLMKENVRKQWRIHLCFGRFKLEEFSEWSNSASVGVQAKPKIKPPQVSVPSVRSVKSSSTDSTSASSDSSQRDSSCKRPNLGLFVNSPALPGAQSSFSGSGALPPYRGTRNHLLDQQEQR
ncbi:adhesion G-protein coupled receptor G4 [Mugil cephalus]|uniref:adhesion G-protein coupled receptor G4 n=1 Tax=Mugil cephalus TaxID=48193 RepID=UPI001FB7FE9D|nr:adhesion G-protein coupled receptor G4 [Mugil cephalus]